jgi:ABC-type polysaccharide/polyol phosphate export permease
LKGSSLAFPPNAGLFLFTKSSDLRGVSMAKSVKEKDKLSKRKGRRIEILPLEATNYRILVAGVAVVILGYIALSMEPWDGFMAITVAPMLLVLGYCVVIPIGIIYRKKKEEVAQPIPEGAVEASLQK